MHDHDDFFLRTTDAKHRFAGRDFNKSGKLKMKELQNLNAGDWFLKVMEAIITLIDIWFPHNKNEFVIIFREGG